MLEFIGSDEAHEVDFLQITFEPNPLIRSYELVIMDAWNKTLVEGPQLFARFYEGTPPTLVTAYNRYQTLMADWHVNAGPTTAPEIIKYNAGTGNWPGIPIATDETEVDRRYGISGVLDIVSPGVVAGQTAAYTKVGGWASLSQGPKAHLPQMNFLGTVTGVQLFYNYGTTIPGDKISGRIELYGRRAAAPPPVVEFDLVNDGSNNANQTWRNVISAWSGSPGSGNVRVTLQSSATNAMTVGSLYIGERDPSSPYNTLGMTQLTFGGNPGVAVPAGQKVASDVVPFALDPAKDYVISHYIVSGATKSSCGLAGCHAWVAAGDVAGIPAPSATWYDQTAGCNHCVAKIEW